jgi:prepilin-type N-terminal cleavage/methylation domain-containing protein
MTPAPRSAAFTLVEMITVIAIIAILAGLILAINGLVQAKSAKARAQAEIVALSGAMDSYKTDNGGYPQDSTKTDTLDPRKNTAADASLGGKYSLSSQFLYGELTGDTKFTGTASNMTRNYAPGFWTPSRLGGPKTNGVLAAGVQYIMDPYGNSYGYSTAGLLLEEEYRATLSTTPGASRPTQNSQSTQGYNPSFDLWSTAGDTLGNTAKWAKNW